MKVCLFVNVTEESCECAIGSPRRLYLLWYWANSSVLKVVVPVVELVQVVMIVQVVVIYYVVVAKSIGVLMM